MINGIMKKQGEKAFRNDLKRIDYSKLSKSVKEEININYANDNDNEHTLDIYYKDNGELKPILIDVHGGGFISHDKEIDRLFGNYMAQKGFIVFNLNYRLAYPKYTVFEQVTDIDKALCWIMNNASKYNANTEEMYICGHSSAGVLAVIEALLCKSDKLADDFNITKRNFEYKGVILDCGLMNFYKNHIAYWGMRNMVFPKKYKKDRRYKGIVFENSNEVHKLPRTLLLTNSKDELKGMTYYFEKVLSQAKVKNKIIDRGSDGHMGIIFKPYTEENTEIIDEIIGWFKIYREADNMYEKS